MKNKMSNIVYFTVYFISVAIIVSKFSDTILQRLIALSPAFIGYIWVCVRAIRRKSLLKSINIMLSFGLSSIAILTMYA